jgi:hypothetical protein
LADKYSATWTMFPTLFTLVIFDMKSHVYAQAGLYCHPPIYTSCVAGMTGTSHHAQLFIGWNGGLTNL